jgi:hypothetical protein
MSLAGVRPCSGAATAEAATKPNQSSDPFVIQLTAPQDGRTPLSTCNRHLTMLRFVIALSVGTCLTLESCIAGESNQLEIEMITLPALRINGQDAKAHTQGLEIAQGQYYVTARREDVRARRALLLNTEPGATQWRVWDLTPLDPSGKTAGMDHPGGLQSDGKRLWIPLAESRSNSHSLIRVYSLTNLIEGQSAKADFEFSVDDHIGALAVDAQREVVLGANWDTVTVYVWTFNGSLKQTLTGWPLARRGLGVGFSSDGFSGVAVQDWKITGNYLVASGLCRRTEPTAIPPSTFGRSRLVVIENFLQPAFVCNVIKLPLYQEVNSGRQGNIRILTSAATGEGTELAREAMARSKDRIYFLPEDLGPSNRLFHVSARALLRDAVSH